MKHQCQSQQQHGQSAGDKPCGAYDIAASSSDLQLCREAGEFRFRAISNDFQSEIEVVSSQCESCEGFTSSAVSGDRSLIIRPESQGLGEQRDGLLILVVAGRLVCGVASGSEEFFGATGGAVLSNGVLKFSDAGVAFGGGSGHCVAGDLHQFARVLHILFNLIFTNCVKDGIAALSGTGQVFERFQKVRGKAFEDFEQDGTQQVDVGLWADATGVGLKQFGSSIGQCAGTSATADQDTVSARKLFIDDCESPVQHDHFTVCAYEDIFRFEVAIDDSEGVCIGDGVADFQKDVEVFFAAVFRHGFSPVPSGHLFHRIEQFAFRVSAEVMYRHDVGVYEICCNDGFGDEHLLCGDGIILIGLQGLNGHFAIERCLASSVDNAHAALGECAENLIFRCTAGLSDGCRNG